MAIHFVSDQTGQKTAVLISIEDWNNLPLNKPLAVWQEPELAQWQHDILDDKAQLLVKGSGLSFADGELTELEPAGHYY